MSLTVDSEVSRLFADLMEAFKREQADTEKTLARVSERLDSIAVEHIAPPDNLKGVA
jgi:hypothetical protein